jgi:hypothetical protein
MGELGTRCPERMSEAGESGVESFGCSVGFGGIGCRGTSSSLDSKSKISRNLSVSGDTEDRIDKG